MALDLHPHIASLVGIGFEGTEPTPFLEEALRAGVSTVILFGRNVGDPSATGRTCERIREKAGGPVLIAIDQEGGESRRLVEGFTPVPAMRALAEGGTDAVRQAAATTASELRSVGIGLDFAPVVDVDTNPLNPVIGERSFSADPGIVSELGAAWIGAMQAGSVASCAKHFPGHGDTSEDSHHDLPRLPHSLERLREIELPPFQAAIDAGVAAIMSAHVVFEAVDSEVPATLSAPVIQGVLRGELDFNGLIISDDLEMEAIAGRMDVGDAAVCAIHAGVDLVLCCHREDRQRKVLDALARELDPIRAEEAAERVATLHANYAS
jgi:beta-N-acetylhexosaminidase